MACPRLYRRRRSAASPRDSSILFARQKAIYDEDKSKAIRKSHENPYIQKLYKEFLGAPLSEKSHHLLHTHYFDKKKVIEIDE